MIAALLADAAGTTGSGMSGEAVFLLAIVAALLASMKNRSALGWFFLGLIFEWLALIVLLFLPSLKGRSSS